MRLPVFLAVALLATACGSSSSSNSGTPFFGGEALASVNSEFSTASTSTACTINFEGTNEAFYIWATKIDFTSWADACGDYFTYPACGVHSGGQSVSLILVTLTNYLSAPVPLPTGTYTVSDNPSATPVLVNDIAQYFQVIYAESLPAENSSGCGTLVPLANSTGTVTLTSVTSSSVSGSLSLQFEGGYTLSGSFTAPVCAAGGEALSAGLCTLAQGFANAIQTPSGPTTLAFCTQPTTCG